jgi:hypothetical protein
MMEASLLTLKMLIFGKRRNPKKISQSLNRRLKIRAKEGLRNKPKSKKTLAQNQKNKSKIQSTLLQRELSLSGHFF